MGFPFGSKPVMYRTLSQQQRCLAGSWTGPGSICSSGSRGCWGCVCHPAPWLSPGSEPDPGQGLFFFFCFPGLSTTFPVKPTPRSVRALWVTGFPEMLFLPASTEAGVASPHHCWGLSVPPPLWAAPVPVLPPKQSSSIIRAAPKGHCRGMELPLAPGNLMGAQPRAHLRGW